METTYYTIRAREIVVSGGSVAQVSGGEGRRLVCTRQTPRSSPSARRDNVISLADYRPRPSGPEKQDWTAEAEPQLPAAPRSRSGPRQKNAWLEWIVSAALIGVALSACAAFLL